MKRYRLRNFGSLRWRILIGFALLLSVSIGVGRQWKMRQDHRRADQIISVFENDTLELQYGYTEALEDGRGLTAGRAGFTTATGDLVLVVERYVSRVPDTPLKHYLPRLKELAE